MQRTRFKQILLIALVVILSIGWWSWQRAKFQPLTPERIRQACESIADHDRRQYCLALDADQVQHCDAIADADLRSFCRGQVAEDPKQCASIQEVGMREHCSAMLLKP